MSDLCSVGRCCRALATSAVVSVCVVSIASSDEFPRVSLRDAATPSLRVLCWEERLAPILMTALTAGFALPPLVLAGDAAGNEIQTPLARVMLGGLLTSTFLKPVAVPVLFERRGHIGVAASVERGQ